MNRYLFLLVPYVILWACAPPPPMGDMVDTDCKTPDNVTMAQLQTQVIDGKCKTCHYPAMGGMAEGSGYAYGDYTSATETIKMKDKASLFKGSAGTLKIVDQAAAKSTAERLANSSLWLKLSSTKTVGFRGPKGESTGNKMPNDGAVLSAAELKLFKDWICTGSMP